MGNVARLDIGEVGAREFGTELEQRGDRDVGIAVDVDECGLGVRFQKVVHVTEQRFILEQPTSPLPSSLLPLEVAVEAGRIFVIVPVRRIGAF